DAKVLESIRTERARGRRIVLATAADSAIATRIADHLGLFDEVIASDGVKNVKGEAKARALAERFGEKGFDYAGDARADRHVWARAREAVVVKRDANPIVAILHGMRVWHWAKNLLVFVPLIAAHHVDASSLFACALALAAFSLTASAVYLANDLL